MTPQSSSLAPRPSSAPRLTPPASACDSHAHVFGPADRFPLAPGAAYAPPAASVEAYVAMLDLLGIARGVLVQAAPYGDDNAAMLDAMARYPDRLRGIALATPAIGDDALADLVAKGTRGLRFSHFPGSDARNIATIGLPALHALAPRLREHGMHAQLWMPCEEFVAEAPALLGLGVPLVLDHLARVRPQDGVVAPAFQSLLGILRGEDVWMKLTPHRASAAFPDYDDLRPFHEAALAARPDRLLWGTDWPFVRMGDATPDAGHLLDVFSDWTTDAAFRHAILVDNPASLYGFGA